MKNSTTVKVAMKYQGMIDEVDKDSDGYWAYSAAGFMFKDMGCHTAHEDTQADLLRVIRSLVPCNCQECQEMLAREAALVEEVKEVIVLTGEPMTAEMIELHNEAEREVVAGTLVKTAVAGVRETLLQGRIMRVRAEKTFTEGIYNVYELETERTLCHVMQSGINEWNAIGRFGNFSKLNAAGKDRGHALENWVAAVNKEYEEELAMQEEEEQDIDGMIKFYYGTGECCNNGSCAECRNR